MWTRCRLSMCRTSKYLLWKRELPEVINHRSQPDDLHEAFAAIKNDTSHETPEFQPRVVDYPEFDNHSNQNEKRGPEATHAGFRLVSRQTLQAPQSPVVIFSGVINRAQD